MTLASVLTSARSQVTSRISRFMPAVRPRERRVLLWGSAGAAIVLLYTYAVEPLRDWREVTRVELETVRRRIEQYDQLLGRRERLAVEGKEAQEALAAFRDRLLTGPTLTLAAAQLQGVAKEEARAAGLVLQRVEVERPAITAPLAEVPVRLAFTGEVGQLVTFLGRIEQHRLALSIPELTIRVKDPEAPRQLIVDVVISGLLLPSGGPAEGPAQEGLPVQRSGTTTTPVSDTSD